MFPVVNRYFNAYAAEPGISYVSLDQQTVDFYIDVWTSFVLKGCNDGLPAFANISVHMARELRHALTTDELLND